MATPPTNLATGAVITETWVDAVYNTAPQAVANWTPAVTQSGSVTVTVTRAKYRLVNGWCDFSALLAVTGSGTGSNAVVISLPVTAANASTVVNGVGRIYDTSTNSLYSGVLDLASTTTIRIVSSQSAASPFYLGGVTFTAALASGDNIYVAGSFEIA